MPVNPFPRVSIIILNWNGWRDTIECLESLYRISYPNYDVVVVDNGSKDDSIVKIKEYADGKIVVNSKFFKYNPNNKPIKVFEISEEKAKRGKFNRSLYEKFDVDRRMILIKNRDNYGFTGGNNVGIKFALSVLNSDYVLLLNNDTVVDKEFLINMVEFMEEYSSAGAINPRILYYDSPHLINSVGGKINSLLGTGSNIGIYEDSEKFTQVAEVDYAYGACMMIKSKGLIDSSLFDESFFIIMEEADLCVRMRARGYRVFYYPYAKIYHKEGISGEHSPTKTYYSHRNRMMFVYKHYTSKRIFLVIPIIMSVGLGSAIKALIIDKNPDIAKAIIMAYVDIF